MDNNFRIFVSNSLDIKPFIDRLGISVEYVSPMPVTEEETIKIFKGANAIIALSEPFSKRVLEALSPELKLISRYGLGFDQVDLEAAEKLGICVTNAAGTMGSGVAETAFLLMLEAGRNFYSYNSDMHNKIWKKEFCGTQLEAKTVGIIGFGNIGQHLAKYLSGFDCKILVYDDYVAEEKIEEYNAKRVNVEELARESDIISIHCPMTPSTFHLVNEEFLEKMKETAILINTSRGPVVDEVALIEALKNKKIRGAGLDVFEQEPIDQNNELSDLNNVILLPHVASFTNESMYECALDIEKSILTFLEGDVPEHCLNKNYVNFLA